jgi:hypothetical protein
MGLVQVKRVNFCGDFKMFLVQNLSVSEIIWFSDETHFNFNGYLSRQNTHVWASEHLCNIMGTLLYPEECNVVLYQKKKGIVMPIFLHAISIFFLCDC